MNSNFKDITPFYNSHASVGIPGSKSISNRALILAVLTKGTVKLNGILDSEDVGIMITALQRLGVVIEVDKTNNTALVNGCGGVLSIKKATIDVGNAGTVARFLTALLSLQNGGDYTLDGSEAMRIRPMAGLLDALKDHGSKFTFHGTENCFPFTIKTSSLNNNDWLINASKSSQIVSAILLIAPLIKGTKKIFLNGQTVSKPFVKMTLDMIDQFSLSSTVGITEDGRTFEVPHFNYEVKSMEYNIEPDATAASYFFSLPISVGGSILVKGLQNCKLQGDIGFCEIISKCGLSVHRSTNGIQVDLKDEILGGDYNFNDISDTFLTLAALSPLLGTPLRISGIAHTRMQETDRVGAMATELRKLGQDVYELDDSLQINPTANLNKFKDRLPLSVDTYDDHRFAMSFAILGSHDLFKNGLPWIRILDPFCCRKTFPNFFDVLSNIQIKPI